MFGRVVYQEKLLWATLDVITLKDKEHFIDVQDKWYNTSILRVTGFHECLYNTKVLSTLQMFPYNWNKARNKKRQGWKKRIKESEEKKAGGYKNLKFQYIKKVNLNYCYVTGNSSN